jgi:hypothetical protein
LKLGHLFWNWGTYIETGAPSEITGAPSEITGAPSEITGAPSERRGKCPKVVFSCTLRDLGWFGNRNFTKILKKTVRKITGAPSEITGVGPQ